eukprot:CAMPEP_0177663200 /NCGR_PEP_ID=MMETSP0447-20121125/19780_1 /TAXON_ID=0 /ORGANISM="Stygamoeba regulata, Strain BSH-02190019" /LENGTH=355 /DNA_ID=CAMNT_0019168983 /DNA_START=20 /DNA_END=1087 /DNA_ORIENTATION=+
MAFSTAARMATFSRAFSSASLSKPAAQAASKTRTVTLIPGDGIGPEITAAVVGAFQAAKVPIRWETFREDRVDADLLASLSRNQVALKGPWVTEIGKGAQSRSHVLRTSLELYANICHVRSLPGVKTRHDGLDMIFVRENTQGEYTGIEEVVVPGVVQSIKIITREASTRIAHAAFNIAKSQGRKAVTCIHKANIMKLSDGCFLESCRNVAKEYPEITFKEMIIDNACMQMAMNPHQFDVLLLPNLYGTLMINMAAGLIGGPGVLSGINVGRRGEAIFEGGRHSGLDIAGKNAANPTGILLASVQMLRHLGYDSHATRIESAVHTALRDAKVHTPDLGGSATTKDFTKKVLDQLR